MKTAKNLHTTYPSHKSAVLSVADEIETLLRQRAGEKRPVVLGLATGATPVPLYQELIRRHRQNGLSFRDVVTFNLDEYCGLPHDDPQSYRFFMNAQLFSRIDIDPSNTHIPDGLAGDSDGAAEAECARYEAAIRAAGGIDLQIVGIGRTGHIGFNEPPAGPETRTRRVRLDEQTRRDNAVFFGDIAQVPGHALTMGVGTILEARRVILLAFGETKAEIVRRALTDTPSNDCPASWLQQHPRCTFALDPAAGALLTPA